MNAERSPIPLDGRWVGLNVTIARLMCKVLWFFFAESCNQNLFSLRQISVILVFYMSSLPRHSFHWTRIAAMHRFAIVLMLLGLTLPLAAQQPSVADLIAALKK